MDGGFQWTLIQESIKELKNYGTEDELTEIIEHINPSELTYQDGVLLGWL